MKDWSVNYSVKFITGTVEERETLIPAKDIFMALEDAKDQHPQAIDPSAGCGRCCDLGCRDHGR